MLCQFDYHLSSRVVKASASREEQQTGVGTPLLPWGFSGVIPVAYEALHQWLRSQVPKDHCWGWLAWCQYTVTGWDSKFDLQHLSRCGSTYDCLSRSVPEILTVACWDDKEPSKPQEKNNSFWSPGQTLIMWQENKEFVLGMCFMLKCLVCFIECAKHFQAFILAEEKIMLGNVCLLALLKLVTITLK